MKLDFSKPGLALFDMDSTLITIECIDELAALVGKKQQVSEITERAMRGELDFASSLKERVAALAGVREDQLDALFKPIPLTEGAAELVAWLHSKGWKVGVVSGGFTWFTEQVKEQLNLDFARANVLVWQQQQLSGEVAEPIIDAQAKVSALHEWAQQLGIPLSQTLAIGDGANDIPMLKAAQFGVAFQAKEALRQVADLCVDEGGLMKVADYFEQLSKESLSV